MLQFGVSREDVTSSIPTHQYLRLASSQIRGTPAAASDGAATKLAAFPLVRMKYISTKIFSYLQI